MDTIYINGVSVVAPGLMQREQLDSILRGDSPWLFQELPKIVPAMLPANEPRRTTPLIKIALQAIQSLLRDNDNLDEIATVFACSDGDSVIEDKICSALAQTDKIVSPTQFHNSVHNAPAGYWAIAASMRAGSVSLSAGDGTFAAGLIDAITQVSCEQKDVLFVAYDAVAPEPLYSARHLEHTIAIALRLGTKPEKENVACINIAVEPDNNNSITTCHNSTLESLRLSNPIGVGIPLLEALVSHSTSAIVIPYIMQQNLIVSVNP